MPAILAHTLNMGYLHSRGIRPRQDGYRRRNGLSPTAIGFLVPLFIVFVFGPCLCIWLVRMRRNSRTIRFVETKKPAEKREDARKRLESVTEVSNVAVSGLYAVKEGSEERKESTDSVSILEQDCAICLSTLHTPSPPEPAKLAAGDIEAARPSSVSGLSISEQDILRLKACGHEFHAQCLISWFIIRKYSCPICRAWYYGKNAELKLNEEHDSDISGSQSIHDRNESNRRREG